MYSSSNEQVFKPSANIKLAEESQEDSKLISPSILIYESWCKCEIDHCVIVVSSIGTTFVKMSMPELVIFPVNTSPILHMCG